MNRTIKFRAWDKENDEMIEGVGLTPEGIPYKSYIDSDNPEDMDYYENSELMQFTGLKDKNGKEIYEGDIVHWGMSNLEVGFGWGDDNEHWQESYGVLVGSSVFGSAYDGECEIIGNIYENPELLQGTHE